MAGDPAERVPRLERAVAMVESSPAQLEHVRCLVDLGTALRRTNRRSEARAPLLRALHLADANGMVLLARRARSECEAAGGRPRRPASSGPRSLTAAEDRVVQLAIAGHSNSEIAAELYVTRRTVETHLTHAFTKLGIAGRTELSRAMDGAVVDPLPGVRT